MHCGGSSSSRPFYQDVASTTGGQYLPLDSLQTMTDTFAALCLREVRWLPRARTISKRVLV